MRKTKRLAVAAVAVVMFGLGGCDSDDPKGSPPATGRVNVADNGTISTVTFTPEEQKLVDDGVEAAKGQYTVGPPKIGGGSERLDRVTSES